MGLIISMPDRPKIDHTETDGCEQKLMNEDPMIVDHETEVSECGEAGLHSKYTDCTKNPGHAKFITLDTFTVNHLPAGYHDNILYDYINCIADLTVRVTTKMTSSSRPKFWPETTQPYPFNNSSTTNFRTGSGIVRSVNKYKDGLIQGGYLGASHSTKCWCIKCQRSDSPSNVWWEFNVYTATHVVFDEYEASHTSLRLFYDRDDSPVVIVDKISVVYVNIKHDKCMLKCVTCDINVGDKLIGMRETYLDAWKQVLGKYSVLRDTHKLTIIVSHPHGRSKKVSVGHWKDKIVLEEDGDIKFSYTTSTCPGSSGASVHCVGYSRWMWFELVHRGSLSSGLNCSGTGGVL
ncbi:uncharacterized protein LOC106063268 isoform X2 [Biomphalaria glabrata]|nr:uncharacterized protein LOC106063268 isoform X2 [Biomphalaria glabrata]